MEAPAARYETRIQVALHVVGKGYLWLIWLAEENVYLPGKSREAFWAGRLADAESAVARGQSATTKSAEVLREATRKALVDAGKFTENIWEDMCEGADFHADTVGYWEKELGALQ